jgi:hypothetical protein
MKRAEIGALRIEPHRLTHRFYRPVELAGAAQRMAEIGTECCEIGRHPDGLADRPFRRGEFARRHQHMAELCMTMRVGGLDLDRFPPQRDRLGMPALHAERMAELGIGVRQMRIRIYDAAVRLFGDRQIALTDGQIAEPPPRLGEVGRQVDRPGRRADGLLQTPGAPERLTQFEP